MTKNKVLLDSIPVKNQTLMLEIITGLQILQQYDENAEFNTEETHERQSLIVMCSGYKKEKDFFTEHCKILLLYGWTFDYEYEGYRHDI